MFYIIETEYVGPNRDQSRFIDAHYYDITTKPGRTNSSHEERVDGWLGTTNDWYYYAHGAYDTIEDARKALLEDLLEHDYREDEELDSYDRDEYGILARYRPGTYQPWGAEATSDWIDETIREDVTGPMTDGEIERVIESYIDLGRSEVQAELDPRAIRRDIEERIAELTADDDEDDEE